MLCQQGIWSSPCTCCALEGLDVMATLHHVHSLPEVLGWQVQQHYSSTPWKEESC